MNSEASRLRALSTGYPVVRTFASFPIACFTCALLTDSVYGLTANVIWADFSTWLLAIGMAGGVLAVAIGLLSWLVFGRSRPRPFAWAVVAGGLLTLVVALFNNLVHSRDAWTSVMPTGLVLSAVTVLIMLATAWLAAGASRRRAAAMPYSGIRQ